MQWPDLTRRQAGVVSRGQLLAAGYSQGRADALLRRGRLLPTRWPAVYRAAGAPLTPESALWASVLDAGAVLSFLSAAEWWDVPVTSDGRIHVTVPNRRRTGIVTGVRVHRVAITQNAVSHRFGMPITNRVETVLDCLGWLPPAQASTLADRAFQQGWIGPAEIARRLDDQPGRWGNRQLGRLLRASAEGGVAESERRLIRLLKGAGVDGWVTNYQIVVGGGRRYELDLAFPELRLAIEVDGWAFHSEVDRFRSDRMKQNALVAAGWTVLRFTWWDVTQRPEQVIATILTLLAA